jgi:hypothetical protein
VSWGVLPLSKPPCFANSQLYHSPQRCCYADAFISNSRLAAARRSLLGGCWVNKARHACFAFCCVVCPALQIPDSTIRLSEAEEADAFISATADSLPPDAIRSTDDRRAPIGKVFLFTAKSSVPGMYKALAAQHFGKSRLLFGWTTTADEQGPALALMQKMNVRGLH